MVRAWGDRLARLAAEQGLALPQRGLTEHELATKEVADRLRMARRDHAI
jgi:hypothetical protein